VLSRRTVSDWFQRLASGDKGLEDRPGSERPSVVHPQEHPLSPLPSYSPVEVPYNFSFIVSSTPPLVLFIPLLYTGRIKTTPPTTCNCIK
jgi:hypothetical protein